MRYLDWIHDPDPADDTYAAEMVYLLHEEGGPVRCVCESHVCGLFSRAAWLESLEAAGFRARAVTVDRAEIGTDAGLVFVGHRA